MKTVDVSRSVHPPRSSPGRRQRLGKRRGLLLTGAVIAATAVAGCGSGGSSSGSVAHVSSSSSSPGSSSPQAKPNAVAYAQCMRSHGVPNFPDPNSQGKFVFSQGLNTSSYQTASQDCKSLAPAGQTSSASTTTLVSQALKFSTCMQKNGVPNYPDPRTSGGGMVLSGGPGLDRNSPAFQRAATACKAYAPGGNAAGLSAPIGGS